MRQSFIFTAMCQKDLNSLPDLKYVHTKLDSFGMDTQSILKSVSFLYTRTYASLCKPDQLHKTVSSTQMIYSYT